MAELKTIIPEVDKYYDFIDEFMNDSEDENGVPSEESNDVAFLLYYAIEEKQRQIEYFPDEIGAADSEIDNFEDYLDDKEWLKYRRFWTATI